MPSRSALVVLGMHRSGTSALTGALRLCGAWVGDSEELTEANLENPQGFWERRDIRRICDQLLHKTQADWWKLVDFDPQAIPAAVLTKQGGKFAGVVSLLNQHPAWVIKEPRLCLLLPVLLEHLDDPVCIHIYRNPLEVARSLQARNGFGIGAGLALWEAYNVHALRASEGLPRVLVSFEQLMTTPLSVINELADRLEQHSVHHLSRPDPEEVEQLVDASLYRRRATDAEAEEYLSPSQLALWLRFRNGAVFEPGQDTPVSAPSRQQLLDLEFTESELNQYREKTRELDKSIATARVRGETIKARDKSIKARDESIKVRDESIKARDESIKARDESIKKQQQSLSKLRSDLRTRNQTLGEQRQQLRKLGNEIQARKQTISGQKQQIDKLRTNLEIRNQTVRELHESASWKITAPLRWIKRTLKDVPGKLQRLRGRGFRYLDQLRVVALRRAIPPQSVDTGSLAALIREHRESRQRYLQTKASPVLVSGKRKTRISVIAWDMGHNPLGRAWLLADVLRRDYEVELIGANFPRFGNKLWGPLRDSGRVSMKSFPGANFPEHFENMTEVAEQIDGDVIYVSKPRLPSLELAILAKLHRNRPLILDVDDYETGFFRRHGPLTLDAVKTANQRADFFCPHDETWTRYSESLIPLFEGLTVSNQALREKFGGMILPHLRDEHDFEPSAYPRDTLRAAFGFTARDKVIVFAGTPRLYKGVERLADALKKLNREDYKLLLIGAPADRKASRLFEKLDRNQVTVIHDAPFHDLPGYLRVGDLVCLLQDEGVETSQYQMPAKFTDALAMGIPVLAANVPPLQKLAGDSLVELLDDTPLEHKISEIFSDYEVRKQRARQNREVFLKEYSYGANLPRLKKMIDQVVGNPAPVPEEFHELIAYHKKIFPAAGDAQRRTAELTAAPAPVCPAPKSPDPSGPTTTLTSWPHIDDKIDIVFFWKQNDSGIYGRRQDMLIKYLSRDPRVHRITHFDAPLSLFNSAGLALKSGQNGRHSQSRWVLNQTLARKLGLKNRGKLHFDTYISWGKQYRQANYLNFLERALRRQRIGERRTVFWVCPNNFDFPAIENHFKPELVAADVIDDQRQWSDVSQSRETLRRNYAETLARSHLTFANCRRVCDAMEDFTDTVHLFPNAAELLEETSRDWPKPAALRRIKGPLIGYAGNLDLLRVDLGLLTTLATERPGWNLIFIGSAHRNREILQLNKFSNVHFLGVRPYEQALRYIRHFDVAMIPHLNNGLTQSMNPLKMYVYFSLHVPVVTTSIENIEDFGEFVQVGATAQEFMERIGHCLEQDPFSGRVERLQALLKENSWEQRVAGMLNLIETEFARREEGVLGGV